MVFENLIFFLDSLGIRDVLLPFLLIFTIVFAVFQMTHLLGDRKNFHVVIALVMALSVVIPHVTGDYPPSSDPVNIINRALPNVSLVLVIVLMALIVLGIFGHNISLAGASLGGWIALLMVLVVLYIFGQAADWYTYPWYLEFLADPETQTLIVAILVFALVVWFITKEDKPGQEKMGQRIGKALTDLFPPVGSKK